MFKRGGGLCFPANLTSVCCVPTLSPTTFAVILFTFSEAGKFSFCLLLLRYGGWFGLYHLLSPFPIPLGPQKYRHHSPTPTFPLPEKEA